MSLDESVLKEMTLAATLGRRFTPRTPEEAEKWVRIQREVAQIKADGFIVDLPAESP